MPLKIMLECSTAHITDEDSAALSSWATISNSGGTTFSPFRVAETEYSFTIFVPPATTERAADARKRLKGAMSQAFWSLIDFAQNNEIEVITLDQDADFHPGLPIARKF